MSGRRRGRRGTSGRLCRVPAGAKPPTWAQEAGKELEQTREERPHGQRKVLRGCCACVRL